MKVVQRDLSVGGDAVAGNKTVNNVERRRTQIEVWMEKLAEEMRTNQQAKEMVESLQYYHQRVSDDGIEGLDAKLEKAGRQYQRLAAYRKKEFFAKLLETYRLYGSAQEIIAFFLSKIDAEFETEVLPFVNTMSIEEIDRLVKEKVVNPILAEAGGGTFLLNHNHVLGMVYWLAEQCFVRWHK